MKTKAEIARSLLLTSVTLIAASAVVSIPNRIARYSTQIVMCSAVIVYVEQLRSKQSVLNRENSNLQQQKIAISQQLQLATEETRSLVQYTDEELRECQERIVSLQETQEKLEKERDDLQLKLWTIEDELKSNREAHNPPQLSLVRSIVSQVETPLVSAQAARRPTVEISRLQTDLSAHKVAIVGGHSKTCKKVTDYLKSTYSLHNTTHILSQRGQYIRRRELSRKLANSDLVVLVTRYIGHPLSKMVLDLKHKDSLNAHILYANTPGYSGIVREIDKYIEQAWLRTA